MTMAHLRLLLGSCIVAQTMVLDEPNWHDWTEAHICQCLDGTSLEVADLEVHPPKNENDVIRFIVFFHLKKYAMFMFHFLLISHLGGLYSSSIMFDVTMFKGEITDKKQVFVQMTQRHRQAILGGGFKHFFIFTTILGGPMKPF